MPFRDFLDASLERIGKKSQAKYVEFGYGQVEPNQLSAQKNGQIYAQLPAAPEIDILEQGQFAKYNYAANDNGIGQVDFEGAGEWMLVYNEIKLYRNHPDGSKQWDCEFAMIKDDYQARVYSPYDYEMREQEYKHRWLNGVDADGNDSYTLTTNVDLNRDKKTVTINGQMYPVTDNRDGTYALSYEGTNYTLESEKDEAGNPISAPKAAVEVKYYYDDFTANVPDIYELNWTNDPFKKLGIYQEKRMPRGMAMVPRLFKTMPGDLFTTNTIDEDEVAIGDILAPNEKGILSKSGDTDAMKWQVVKIYTMPDDMQKGVKVMRIA